MNAVDPELVGIGHAALADIDGVRPVEELRQRWSGHQLLADVTVASVPPLSMDASTVAHRAEDNLTCCRRFPLR